MKLTTVAIFDKETSSLYVNNYHLAENEAVYQAMLDSDFVFGVPIYFKFQNGLLRDPHSLKMI
jgi:hypothetical protein